MNATLTLRLANIGDAAFISEVYNASIPGRMATAALEEESLDTRELWLLDQKWPNSACYIGLIEEEPIGWIAYKPFYGRMAYINTVEISIYIHPSKQRNGLGSSLLQAGIKQVKNAGKTTCLAFIFSHNTPSLALFKNHGFLQWGQLPDVALMDGHLYSLTILGKDLSSNQGVYGTSST
jgi:L-amino acid N-acyltransferase YncA